MAGCRAATTRGCSTAAGLAAGAVWTLATGAAATTTSGAGFATALAQGNLGGERSDLGGNRPDLGGLHLGNPGGCRLRRGGDFGADGSPGRPYELHAVAGGRGGNGAVAACAWWTGALMAGAASALPTAL